MVHVFYFLNKWLGILKFSPTLPESNSNKDLKDQQRVYYDFAADLKYFQVSKEL